VENPAFSWITGLIRFASLMACLVVAVSFILFATHQADTATSNQVSSVTDNNSAILQNAADKPSSVRKAITNASDTLTSPFSNVLGSDSAWPVHLSQLIIALLLYGFGVSFAVRWLRMRF
jgi:hypothetical protein